jgi:TalC/MipB family fructose-6-phosphate aldolase
MKKLEIFLDTFDIESIEKYADFITGITTNPLILAKYINGKKDFLEKLAQIMKNHPNLLINLQVTEPTASGMIEEAKHIIEQFGNRIIIKIPLNFEGLKALKEISKMGVMTNGTLCFSLFQAKVAQDYGVTYISPFLGRMEGAQDNIIEFIHNLVNLMVSSKILAASIRNVRHVEIALQAKCDAITVNEVVFESIFKMPLLLDGQRLFDEANKFKFEVN